LYTTEESVSMVKFALNKTYLYQKISLALRIWNENQCNIMSNKQKLFNIVLLSNSLM